MKRNRNRESVSIILLLPVLIPLLFIVLNDLGKWQLKYRSYQRMKETANLVQLHIPEDKVQWMDKHEIFVEGRMFDIKKAELKNGWFTFTGHFDDKETSLLKKQQAAQQHNAGQQTLLQVFKSLQQLYFDAQESGYLPEKPGLLQPFLRNDPLLLVFLDVSTPPPRLHSTYTV